jgi:hypothetical protein
MRALLQNTNMDDISFPSHPHVSQDKEALLLRQGIAAAIVVGSQFWRFALLVREYTKCGRKTSIVGGGRNL